MTSFVQPLDLKTILVQNLAGSSEIFSFIAILFIAGLGAYFRMNNGALFMMVFLFSFILSFISQGMFILSLILASIFIVWSIIKLFKN